VKIEVPWNLTVGAETIIGDDVILYCLGPITIGARLRALDRADEVANARHHWLRTGGRWYE
jgi:hypothetical protein